MRRILGRIGGAAAGIIAIAFGILDAIDKVPPCLLITLGAVAIVGVLADYFWRPRDDADKPDPPRVKQRQQAGQRSTNNQAGRDININTKPGERT